MARLKVRLRGKILSEIPLEEGRSYTAGRKDDCDILLEGEKGISREHFRIASVNGVWTLDVLSRFGEILLGGEKISTTALDHGTTFTVPPYEFEFLMTSGDPLVPSDRAEGPVVAYEEGFSSGPADEGSQDGALEKTYVGVAPSLPYIKISDAQGEAKELIRLDGGDLWIGGRDSSCHILIRDQRVSRKQFEIRKSGTSYSILDLGSVNGTLLNGNPISNTEPYPLKSGDAISVLENYLYFELHDPHFKSRLEMVNLQTPLEVVNPLVPLEVQNDSQMNGMRPMPSTIGGPGQWNGGLALPGSNHGDSGGEWPSAPAQDLPLRFDFKKNRMRLILVAVIVVLGLLMLTSKDSDHDMGSGDGGGASAQDPLSKLNPEQKKLVRDTLDLAKSYYMQGKYEFARSELHKMTEIVPEYQDSRELMKLVNEAIYVQEEQRKQEDLEKSQRENEEKIQRQVVECRKIIVPEVTREQMEGCLSSVMHFNPAHPLFEELFGQIAELQAQKEAKVAAQAAYSSEVAALRSQFQQAKRLEDSSKPLSAIKAYERVIFSSRPDPEGLKSAARQKIVQIRNMMNSKTASMQQEADKHEKEGRLKEAILALRKAKAVDPQNEALDDRIRSLTLRLQEEMMRIYQEGILEESFGNVEGDETRQGAKQKWKEILKRDIPEGEYYKKAVIKLKKYGSAP